MAALTRIVVILAALIGVWAARDATAQTVSDTGTETSPDQEDSYYQLRRSKDRARQLAAERYFNLVKPQEWTDATGKFRTTAKYVEHGPDLAWVKLEAVRGRGADRVVRQIEVPVEKLSKQCQSRVRQIARLQPKLDELILAEAKDREEEDSPERGGESEQYAEGGEVRRPGARSGEFAEEAEDASAYGNELNREAMVGPPGRGADTVEVSAAGVNPEMLMQGMMAPDPNVDRTQWRTSYDSFRGNFSMSLGPDGQPRLEWGELHELKALSDALSSLGKSASRETGASAQTIADAASAVGNVTWEVPFLGLSTGLLGDKPMFGLPPIVAPVSLQFVVADASERKRWRQLQPGQTVRIRGQLKMTTPSSIVVWAHLEDAGTADASAENGEATPSYGPVTAPPDRLRGY